MMRLKDLFDHKLSAAALGGLIVLLVVVVAFYSRTSAVDPRVTLQQERASYGGRSAPDMAAVRSRASLNTARR